MRRRSAGADDRPAAGAVGSAFVQVGEFPGAAVEVLAQGLVVVVQGGDDGGGGVQLLAQLGAFGGLGPQFPGQIPRKPGNPGAITRNWSLPSVR